MEQNSTDAAARALAFANGLRKNTANAGRRWSQWPGGTNDLATVLARIDGIAQRLQALKTAQDAQPAIAECFAGLRAILEWTTYQSASVATARALLMARKTRTFAERFGLLEDPAARLSILTDSEASLIENVRTKNDYMAAIAARHPQLELPRPLVDVDGLAPKVEKAPGKLALIQQLMKSAKKK
jgi:hypothetical protein